MFHAFRDDADVRLIGVEAGGEGIKSGRHAARFSGDDFSRAGVLHGARTFILQDSDGQIMHTHSISAGLDYAAVGPEHSYLRDMGRTEYTYATDEETLAAFQLLCQKEGIIPALESSHAVAEAIKLAPTLAPETIMLVNHSGRGDKDLDTVIKALGDQT
jgi:tryptophan synthase beta chain